MLKKILILFLTLQVFITKAQETQGIQQKISPSSVIDFYDFYKSKSVEEDVEVFDASDLTTVEPDDDETESEPDNVRPDEVPDVSEVPDVPEIPEESDDSEVPDVPEVPEVPEIPEVTDVPKVPEVPEVPNTLDETENNFNVVNYTFVNDVGETIMYTGPLEDGLPNGEGVGYGLDENGEVAYVYEGSWKNGLMDGYGEMTYPNRPNYYYKGGWKNGKRVGEGERRDDDGTRTFMTPVE